MSNANHNFIHQKYDWQTGVYYYRARSYDANLGRFLQRDPAGMVDGPNMYAYCGNDPVNRRDPGGRWAENPASDCWKPGRIDPRTGEPVPLDMYIDPYTGEYWIAPLFMDT